MTAISMGSVLHKNYKDSTLEAYLYARYQIQTKCDSSCRDFRFTPLANVINTTMNDIYQQILTIAWVGGFSSAACLVFLIHVVLVKRYESTQ